MHRITLVNAHTTHITESKNFSGSLVPSHTVLTTAHSFTRLLMHSTAARCEVWWCLMYAHLSLRPQASWCYVWLCTYTQASNDDAPNKHCNFFLQTTIYLQTTQAR